MQRIAHHRTYSSDLACVRTAGALFFWGRRAHAQPMPRYYFILVYPDRITGDPCGGTVPPSDEAAIGAARTK